MIIDEFSLPDNYSIRLYLEKADKKNLRKWVKRGHQNELYAELLHYLNINKRSEEYLAKIEWHILVIYYLAKHTENAEMYFLKACMLKDGEVLKGSDIFLGFFSFVYKFLPVFCEDIRCCKFFNIIENVDKSSFIWYVAKVKNFDTIKEKAESFNGETNFNMFGLVEDYIVKNYNVEVIWLRAFTEALKKFYDRREYCEVEFLECKGNHLTPFRKIDNRYMCKVVNQKFRNILKALL